jgi:flagellar biosynthesis chaperone FliJ
MRLRLQKLLELRRHQEEMAAAELRRAVTARARAEAEQCRLDERARQGRERLARLQALKEPVTAAAALAGERARRRRSDEAAAARREAEGHRSAALAGAAGVEAAARAEHLRRRQAREVVEKLRDRTEAEQRRRAERRAEDAATGRSLLR